MVISGSSTVPFVRGVVGIVVIDEASTGLKLRDGAALEDVAPTILGLLGLEKPAEMTGRDLREL